MKILVCGGRDFYKYSLLKDTLEDIISHFWADGPEEDFTIIAGGAAGADFLAKVFVLDNYRDSTWMFYKEFPADWKAYGMLAGHIRNQQMLDEGKPDLVMAFPGGRGTADMVARAKKAGVKVIEVTE